MLKIPWLGLGAVVVLVALMRVPYCPAAPLMLIAATVAAGIAHEVTFPETVTIAWSLPPLVMPAWGDIWRAFEHAVLPQLPLTLTNAVIVTAMLCRDLFPTRAQRASERNLAISSGLANLLLTPFGAMPMCHGAGGLQAQYRFGGRTGLAPILFGAVLPAGQSLVLPRFLPWSPTLSLALQGVGWPSFVARQSCGQSNAGIRDER